MIGGLVAFDLSRWLGLLVLAFLPAFGHAAPAQPIVLDDRTARVDVWPVVTILVDAEKTQTIEKILATKPVFKNPETTVNALGLRKEAIWLQIPFATSQNTNGLWVLDIDFSVINRADVYLVAEEKIITRAVLGNLVPKQERLVHGRALTTGLVLNPGTPYSLYIRLENRGTMILPISLSKPSDFLERALGEQMLQGLLAGLGLCLLVYSLGQWVTLGENLFLKYAILISGSILFSLLHFGVGAQFLWPGSVWMEMHAGGLSALLAATGSFLFVEQVLAGQDMGPTLSRLMKIGAGLTVFCGILYAFDVFTVEQVTFIVSTLGLAPSLLGLPGAIRRARRGDIVGYYFLIAWAVYFVTTFVLIEVIKGRIGANFWTMHSFQFGATLDMLIFMRVLGLQTREIKVAAQQARLERDSFHSMAHTDPLTGLPNRRILNTAISSAIAQLGSGEILAVYMLDLDGFKQVNDTHGHDVGDELLIAVANRLKSNLRSSDVISRLGGDEFLVMSGSLKNTDQAHELGDKLVKALREPFVLTAQTCNIGLTVGYAIAPEDGKDTRTLLIRADSAMYVGKQEGKNCLRRATLVGD